MRKYLTIFCVVALGLFWVGAAFAANENAYFKIDADLATKGYQETQPKVSGIAATKQIGFAIYSQGWDNAKGFTVAFEWDSTKADFRKPPSDTQIQDNEMSVNGATITPPAETNILGSTLISAGEVNLPGKYSISWAQQGGAASTTSVGLVYFAIFRTTSTFKTTDVLSIKASVTVADETGAERFLGYRYFNVNQVAVKDATWGDVKNQFKNF